MNKTEARKIWKACHIAALKTLGFKPSAFNRLRALENRANWLAVQYCNGNMQEQEYTARANGIEKSVKALCGTLPAGFFVNDDPRGYALKIESDNLPEGMHTDWGGYGILAPEF